MESTLNKQFELMGMHAGDGCISINEKYSEYALLGDMREEREYHESYVIPLFNKLVCIPILGKKIRGKEYPSNGVFGFHIFNPKITQYFIDFGFKKGPKTNLVLPEIITNSKPENKKAFLRGLFDTDGSISFEKNYTARKKLHNRPKIKIATTSKKFKNQIKNMCNDLGIKTIDKKPYKGKRDKNIKYELVIYRKKDIEKWINDIGFNNTKHKTKIAIWKMFGYCPPHTTIKQRKLMLREIGSISCQT